MVRCTWSHRVRRLASGVLIAAAAACSSDVVLVEPAVDAASALQVRVELEDSALARVLGWTNGVPGATVSLRWEMTELFSDSLGRVMLNLPARTYWLTAERRLDEAERVRAGGQTVVVGGGAIAGLERGKTFTVRLRAHDPGSLVISEYYYHRLWAHAVNYRNFG